VYDFVKNTTPTIELIFKLILSRLAGKFQVPQKFEYLVFVNISKGLRVQQTVASSLCLSLSLSLMIIICYRNKLLKFLGRLFLNLSHYFACCFYLVSSICSLSLSIVLPLFLLY